MGHTTSGAFRPAHVAVLTISDTRTLETDTSGQVICEALNQAGHQLHFRGIVRDEIADIRKALEGLLEPSICECIILTGGTGLTQRDVTPEALTPYVSKEIPGFGELFRMLSYEEIGTATIQSRAMAILSGKVVIFALPGSTGACRLAMDRIIIPQLDNTQRPCNFRSIIDVQR